MKSVHTEVSAKQCEVCLFLRKKWLFAHAPLLGKRDSRKWHDSIVSSLEISVYSCGFIFASVDNIFIKLNPYRPPSNWQSFPPSRLSCGKWFGLFIPSHSDKFQLSAVAANQNQVVMAVD